jgi:hypothetical protein
VISDLKIWIKSGIKQGCALSMFLYTLGIEELLVSIFLNEEIKGYLTPSYDNIPRAIKTSAYADDVAGIIRNFNSIKLFFNEFKQWGLISGAIVNEEKTKIMALNSNNSNYNGSNFVDNLKILGITFDKNGISSINLKNCIKKIQEALNMWKRTNLNLIERIVVLKTFALSKLWYQANFSTLSEQEIVLLEKMMFNFIYNNKAHLIKHETLMSEYNEGGLKMVSVRAKLQTIAIKNFIYLKKNKDTPQYHMSDYWLNFQLREFIANFNIAPGGDGKDMPIFFIKILQELKTFKVLYSDWVSLENSNRKKKLDLLKKKDNNNDELNNRALNPIETNFLKNQRLLTSRFIYTLFLAKIKNVPKFSPNISTIEHKNVFTRMHRLINNSSVILVNYKLILNGLPVNKKFNCRYDKICFLCKKKTSEDLGHLFVDCEVTKKCFASILPSFKSKTNSLSQELIQLKLNVSDDDYRQLSKFVYSIWRTRNTMKHGTSNFDPFTIFKNIFNTWSISKRRASSHLVYPLILS